MKRVSCFLAALLGDNQAVTALEYGMIAALIFLLAVSGFGILGTRLSSQLSTVNTLL